MRRSLFALAAAAILSACTAAQQAVFQNDVTAFNNDVALIDSSIATVSLALANNCTQLAATGQALAALTVAVAPHDAHAERFGERIVDQDAIQFHRLHDTASKGSATPSALARTFSRSGSRP